MGVSTGLHAFLDESAASHPNRTAVEDSSGGEITYRDLAILSDRVRDWLVHRGVGRGDRVSIYLAKSIDAVAAIFGTLKDGAAYIPVDPNAPASRNAYILADCRVKALIVEGRFAEALRGEPGGSSWPYALLQFNGAGNGVGLAAALDQAHHDGPAKEASTVLSHPDDLAYILYTSGSTGRPKGVMLSHRNAVSFVDWCSRTFEPRPQDRFSSHAPFHFDLSILDMYVPLKHGATLVLIGSEAGKDPARLASLIVDRRLTVWYSTPSILSLLVQYGDLAEHDLSALRTVLFAGEVFPIAHLRALKEQLPHPRYFNLYGPTETNVCTYFEVPETIAADRAEPYPIGKTCSHLESLVVEEAGAESKPGEQGELCIRGPAVTEGYWNLPEQTAAAFLTDGEGRRWYRTGDLVVEDENGDYVFRGRRDRMVKKRGFRVELGEIEAILYRHPDIRQAAVIALDGDEGVMIKAFVSSRSGKRLSVIALKGFCSQQLPLYMVPDRFSSHPSLPTTSTDKIDYQALKDLD